MTEYVEGHVLYAALEEDRATVVQHLRRLLKGERRRLGEACYLIQQELLVLEEAEEQVMLDEGAN